MKKENHSNYSYGFYINQKAIKDYHINNNLDDNYFKSTHLILMSFIISQYRSNSKMPSLTYQNKLFKKMNTDFILDNLIFLGITKSQLKKYLQNLKQNSLIEIYVKDKYERYIYVNSELINLYNPENYTKVNINDLNYLYSFYVNQKAIKDYHINNNLDDNYFKSTHLILMSFIISQYRSNSKMPSLTYQNKLFKKMNTDFILDNLIFSKIKKRRLQECLQDFKDSRLIEVYVKKKHERYVFVNSELINLCNPGNEWTLKSTFYLHKNAPKLWKLFRNEWEPHFKTKEDFIDFIDYFNLNREIKGDDFNTQNIYDHLVNAVRKKLRLHNKQ